MAGLRGDSHKVIVSDNSFARALRLYWNWFLVFVSGRLSTVSSSKAEPGPDSAAV